MCRNTNSDVTTACVIFVQFSSCLISRLSPLCSHPRLSPSLSSSQGILSSHKASTSEFLQLHRIHFPQYRSHHSLHSKKVKETMAFCCSLCTWPLCNPTFLGKCTGQSISPLDYPSRRPSRPTLSTLRIPDNWSNACNTFD